VIAAAPAYAMRPDPEQPPRRTFVSDKQTILGMRLGHGYGAQPGARRAPGVDTSDYTSFDRPVGYA
jgi:hypothetical protein